MDNEPKLNLENQTEVKRINVLLEKNKDLLGDFDLVPVGEVGYILQSSKQRPMAGNDWVLFDYDDTLVATTEVKKERLKLYKEYLEEQNIQVTEDQASTILNITDKFSRWEEKPGEGKLYHANSHMAVLQWATNIVRESKNDLSTTMLGLEEKLNKIKNELSQEAKPEKDDPFYFHPETKKLVLRSLDKMWSKGIEDIFLKSMINPPQYKETIEAVKTTSHPNDSIHRTNVGVFTYGDPYYQLLKVFELMKQHPDFSISQIWLTRVPKGDFIVEAVKEKTTSKFKQDYVPSNLEEDPGEGISYGSGYVLGQTDHVVVMLDDNPKELTSILSANSYLKENTKSEFVVVRSKRSGTKEEKRDWNVSTRYGELDFVNNSFLPNDISNTFIINRYLSVKSRLGENHPNTQRLYGEIKSRGITLNGN